MEFREDVILGVDIGIGSIGWALLKDSGENGLEIFSQNNSRGEWNNALGSRVFSIPEEPKTKELLNRKRRAARQQRRVIKRRARRMRRLRNLLEKYGISGARDIAALHQPRGRQLDPWRLRVEGLERVLNDQELAVLLLHLAKHRGFRSNSKKDKSGTDKETGKMLKAVGTLEQRLHESSVPTVGVLLAAEPRKRNRSGIDGKPVYERTMLRSLLERESAHIFARQRELGNPKAGETLQKEYAELAFEQRPLRSSAELVGFCTFLPEERRAPKYAPTAEKFRLTMRLLNLRLTQPGLPGNGARQRALNRDEISKILSLLGGQKSISYSSLRKTLKLTADWRFEGLNYGAKDKNGREENPEKSDLVSRSAGCGPGTYILNNVLGAEDFARLMRLRTDEGRACLDALAKIISDNDDITEIAKAFTQLPLSEAENIKLMQAVRNGDFSNFKGAMRLSLKAMEEIIPLLLETLSYDEACAQAGFDHSRAADLKLEDVRNPVVRRILRELRQQVKCLTREFGVVPGKVHVELLRDVGKSADERNQIDKGMKKRGDEKQGRREHLAGHWGVSPEHISADELLRYELWLSQGNKCAYYMLWRKADGERFYGPQSNCREGAIDIRELRDSAHSVQVDHILPRSRTQDNSFHNLCLCTNAANQNKGNRTPYEWLGASNPEAWHEFANWVEAGPFKGLKRRNFLLKDLSEEKEKRFCERNLNDSRYAARLVKQWFEKEYEYWGSRFDIPTKREDGTSIRRVFARPGGVTAFLRRAWGLDGLKKDAAGKRTGDRHHALDAFIVACCSESALQKATRLFQQVENNRPDETLAPPMPHCRERLATAVRDVFVSRAERGKLKGPLHKETLRAVRQEKDEAGQPVRMLYERVAVDALKKDDLKKIKDAERCPDVIKALSDWIEAGKPKDQDKLPRSAKGDIIRRVRLRLGRFSSGVIIKRGSGEAQADNASMVRTEVYIKDGKFYLLPVYTWQVAQGIRPERVIAGGKDEAEWPLLDASYTFCFSLLSDSYIVTEDSKGAVKEGYFVSTDRTTAAITLAMMHDREEKIRGLGVQRLKRFEKYRVDRLGRLNRVKKEKRP